MPRIIPQWRTRPYLSTAFSLCVSVLASVAALGQTPSTDDTIRVEAVPAVNVGQEIDVTVSVHSADTLGGFVFRMVYDPLVFAPLLDTVIEGNDTSIVVVSSQLHPGSLEHFAGAVREPGVVTFLGVDTDLDSSALFLPGSWPVVQMRWQVLSNAPQGLTFIDFENDPLLPATFNTMTNWRGTTFIRPVLAGTVTEVKPGPVPSDIDTMRIVIAPVVGRGQEIDVDINLRVVDTLGAFAYRLRYDPLVFEPVQDTLVSGDDTLVWIIGLDLHPGPFEQFAGSVREPGVITFLGADLDLDTAELYLPGSWPTVGMRWRVLANAPSGPTAIYFENDPVFPATWNAFSDWRGEDFIRPVLVDAATDIGCGCTCFAEPGSCDGALDIVDVLAAINIAFRSVAGAPDPNPLCPVKRADVDCDGTIGIVDVIKIIEVAFRDGDPTLIFCNPCE